MRKLATLGTSTYSLKGLMATSIQADHQQGSWQSELFKPHLIRPLDARAVARLAQLCLPLYPDKPVPKF